MNLGLDELVKDNQQAGRIKFTTDIQEAVNHGVFQFIAVGTPPDEDGAADLQYVLAVAKSIAENMNDYRIVIDKSTVPVGTADKVKETICFKCRQNVAWLLILMSCQIRNF